MPHPSGLTGWQDIRWDCMGKHNYYSNICGLCEEQELCKIVRYRLPDLSLNRLAPYLASPHPKVREVAKKRFESICLSLKLRA